ncbi:branched-chain amino acid ABC transporter permease [Phaeacidiphilus oryzae]|uniref:branched-chain amino acid ABC transporter permease n=1 Tax=Phaeacidiphilus oryzae TaxID=348818 RepID=UPI00056810D9|nr:branched-chain amino acid ABC transporter permease [Phaeacidiphilus oryzae]
MGSELVRAVVEGVLTGGVYALMAAGLTLVFGVMDIINIAQGIMVVLGAYLAYVLQVHAGIDPFVGLVVTVPAMFLLGMGIEWGFVRRLRRRGRAGRDRAALSVLVTFAVAIVIEGVLTVVFSADLRTLNAWYVRRSWQVAGLRLPYVYLFGFGLAVVLLAALYLFLYRTRGGFSLRASMENRDGAELIGVEIDRVCALTFGLGTAVTAAGGAVFGATNTFDPNSGYDLISRLLVIVVLGGLGSIGGALVAAVAALVIEDVTAVLWSPVWASTVFFAVLIAVLLLRPNGLFGRPEARTA